MNYQLRLLVLLGMLGILAAGCHGGDTLTSQRARCGPTPTLLLPASAYQQVDAAAGENDVLGIAVDGSDLYFSVALTYKAGALMRVSTSGGPVTELASGYQFHPPAVTPTSVVVGYYDYSSYTGGILSVPRSGGAATPLVDLGSDDLIAPPVTDGTSVYFVTAYGFVEAAPLTPGASPTSPTLLGSGHGAAHGMAVAGQDVFVNDGQISELSIGASDAGRGTTLGPTNGPAEPLSLIACGADACWVPSGDSPDIEQFDPVGGALTPVAGLPDSVAGANALLFDGSSFFVVGSTVLPPSSGDSIWTIERIPPQGAPAAVATVPQSALGDIALDDACLYVATPTGIYSLSTSATDGVVVP
jgi:hypothetical protein